VVVMARHSRSYGIELARPERLMRTPVLIDGRNVFDKDKAWGGLCLQGRRRLLEAVECIETSQWRQLCRPITRKS